jgi:hypothetical protein
MRRDFDEFVLSRSARLLRTAYLLTRDWAAAEDLLQTALVKAWFVWSRMESDPGTLRPQDTHQHLRHVVAPTMDRRGSRR